MKQKNILITGASRGIGYETALYFARKGHVLFLNCKKNIEKLKELQDKIQTQFQIPCYIFQADLSKKNEIDMMFQAIYAIQPHIDVLINNAGISYQGLINDTTSKEWQLLLDTNLTSAFECCKYVIPQMVREKKGCIINISSMWGIRGASCEVAYSASKAGLNGFTMALAKELAPSQIPVNALAFGAIDTEMNQHLSEEERALLVEEIPMGRFASSQEAAQAIYLLSEAPSYLTGQIICMDGGYL